MATTAPTASTREAYGRTLLDLGATNQNIVVLGGDLNVSTFVHLFRDAYPERFFDFGPAEQNIMSVAAGLASSGKTPFVSTFAVFGTGRPFDQIRVGIAQPHLNVKIVCTHSGIITGEDGMSAHSIEDLSLMCSLPGMTVLTPSDAPETVAAVKAAASMKGPVYIRLYRSATPVLHPEGCDFTIGKAETVKDGTDVTIVSTGAVLHSVVEASESLAGEGISCRVVNMGTLKPVDEETLVKAAAETGAVVTVEEHYLHGGLGSIVAGTLGRNRPVPIEMVGLEKYAESGKPDQLLEKHGLTAAAIAQAARTAVSRK
jgi:transketolase